MNLIEKWKPHAGYTFIYENYQKKPIEQIIKLCQHFKIEFKPWIYTQIYNRSLTVYRDTRRPIKDDFNSQFYRTTLMTQKHNTSNGVVGHYVKNLSREEIKELNSLIN
jgi:hypothetical protein